ncbi:putative ATP-dependent RNA helicase TDRD12 [Anticarsia gemmatalis]|uniref:putative ATP-dependent RNA helicase TDRD12 n=1 Tax=Anticarsia gemmatalis TaxID=129554 RepID=UPI003F75A006
MNMEPDKYKVEILHYLNPHLIWVLVGKHGTENPIQFEQVGIYGIMPLKIRFDVMAEAYVVRCEEWQKAVMSKMKSILRDATEVWFSTTYLDRTSSLFDNNIHKYGDITLTTKDGSTVSMLKELLKMDFVEENIQYFHQNQCTKLDFVTSVAVMNAINRHLKPKQNRQQLQEILDSQTTVYRRMVELNEIDPRNLEVGARGNYQQMIDKQIEDLNACKDLDEVSAGRATNIRSFTGARKKNLEIMRSMSRASSVMDNASSSKYDSGSSATLAVTPTETETLSTAEDKKSRRARRNRPGKDLKEKKLIGFGPAGMSISYLPVREIDADMNPFMALKQASATEPECKPNDDMLANDDSEVNATITNLKDLKLKSVKQAHLASDVQDEKQSIKNIPAEDDNKPKLSALQRRRKLIEDRMARSMNSSSATETDSIVNQGDDTDSECLTDILPKLEIIEPKKQVKEPEHVKQRRKINVNPFKNLDVSQSVFVEKLVKPTIMVHSKNDCRIHPVSSVGDNPFGPEIHLKLRDMSVRTPMRPQTVSWPVILRGHSLFLVGPSGSGKTLGYLPAVCRTVSDYKKSNTELSVTRLSCIIVCGTAKSVHHTEELCRMFLHQVVIFACHAGMTDLTLTTSILNGLDILICTPKVLVRLIRDDLGLEIRNLQMFVVDDCERVADVYANELKFCLLKIKEMLKSRVNKEMKVQYIVASRIWCSLMSSLARKAPDSVICISAFQECVLYSEVDTSVEFLSKDKKIAAVVKFLSEIDKSKKTVIACRNDEEVHLLESNLSSLNYIVFACDNTMTLNDLYKIDLALAEFKEPVLGPIIVCCDSNLDHLNLTDVHYLIHYSLPDLFSKFCKRFSVLIDNYPSIFKTEKSDIRIKIFIENGNVEQLPKILHFINRCSDNIPPALNEISSAVMLKKDMCKARNFVALCDILLSLGECPDVWNCKDRHALFEKYDKPKNWIPKQGEVTFKILHYHSAVHYSARLTSCKTKSGFKKFPQAYSMLTFKLSMYYSKEFNRKLHGVARPGDICAVALKQNLYARCQVVKIISVNEDKYPTVMLINLLDEEKYEMARDTCLYFLPDELKNIETHVVRVILSNIMPEDKDITYSNLAENQLKTITEKNDELFMRGQVKMVIKNCIFVDTLEACQRLSSLDEVVVKSNFKNELLAGYAIENPDHLTKLRELGKNLEFMKELDVEDEQVIVPKPMKSRPTGTWAYLEYDKDIPVYYLFAMSPTQFFIQLAQFKECLRTLLNKIKMYVSDSPESATELAIGDLVLAEFPDDAEYERARIDNIIDDSKVDCFFLDLGDWRVVAIDKILTIPENIVTLLPFQAIECRLTGIKCDEDNCKEATEWFIDQFYDDSDNLKYMYAKRFTTEKAVFTGGSKYGVGLMDCYDKNDVYINQLMIDAGLAEINDETEFLDDMNARMDFNSEVDTKNVKKEAVLENSESEYSYNDFIDDRSMTPSAVSAQNAKKSFFSSVFTKNKETIDTSGTVPASLSSIMTSNGSIDIDTDFTPTSSNQIALKGDTEPISGHIKTGGKLLRSVDLVGDDDEDDDKWDLVNFDGSLLGMVKNANITGNLAQNVPGTSKMDENTGSKDEIQTKPETSVKTENEQKIKVSQTKDVTDKPIGNPKMIKKKHVIKSDEYKNVTSQTAIKKLKNVLSYIKSYDDEQASSSEESELPAKQALSPTEQRLTSTAEPVSPAKEPLTSNDEPVSPSKKSLQSTDKPKEHILASDEPISSSNQPGSPTKETVSPAKDHLIASDELVSSTNLPLSPTDGSVSPAKEPLSSTDKPVSPISSTKQLGSPSNEPLTPAKQSLSPTKQALSFTDEHISLAKQPGSPTNESVSRSKQALSSTDEPISSPKQAFSPTKRRLSSTDKPATPTSKDKSNYSTKLNTPKHKNNQPSNNSINEIESRPTTFNFDISESKTTKSSSKSDTPKTDSGQFIKTDTEQEKYDFNNDEPKTIESSKCGTERESAVLSPSSDINYKKPTLLWRQDKNNVYVKIKLTSNDYDLIVEEKNIKFYADENGDEYAFDFELYAPVDERKCTHYYTKNYVKVDLKKIKSRFWFSLNKGHSKKWIANDSSDDESEENMKQIKITEVKQDTDNQTINTEKQDFEKQSPGSPNSEMIPEKQRTEKQTSEIKNDEKQVEKQSPEILNIEKKPEKQTSKVVKQNVSDNSFDSQDKGLRKPKIVWREVKSGVVAKILIITENYDLVIKEKHMKFSCNANDTEYGFEIELYGVVNVNKCSHTNKGQYVQVNLTKVLNKRWLNLSKSLVKWIVYDVDDIDASSEEDNLDISTADLKNNIKARVDLNSDSDVDFHDDVNFRMRY